MTKPRTAGELLSQRPHTKLAADDEDEADDSGDDAEDDSGPELSESGYAPADDALGNLLDSAGNSDMKLPQYQAYWQRLRSTVVGSAQNLWTLSGPEAAGRIAPVVYAGQQASSHLTQLYAARSMGVKFTPFDPGPGITERPGVSKLDVYSRPAREDSVKEQLRRLSTLANTDLQLAKTRTLFSAFDEDQEVNRAPVRAYRRVTEGENPCGLCEIAAQQLYFTTDLMPIHDNCMCDVEMADDIDEHEARYHHLGFVDTLIDIGDQKKDIQALADADADLEDYVNLTKIEQHGELGPVIRWSGQKFTGPQDLPDPTSVRPVPTISGPGRGHEARLRSNAARVASQRRQRGNRGMRYSTGHGGLSTYLPPQMPKTIVPKALPDNVIPLRRPTKAVDWDRDPISDVVSALADKHKTAIDPDSWNAGQYRWDDKQFNEDAKRETLKALDEMLTKYPDVKVGKIQIGDLDPGVFAETAAEATRSGHVALNGRSESLIISADQLRRPVDEVKRDYHFAERSQFFFSGSADNPYRDLVFHEYGHVLNNRGGRVASDEAGRILAETWQKSGIPTPMPKPLPVRDTDTLRIQTRNMQANHDAMQKWYEDNQQAFAKWLAEKDRVSGYSMIDQEIPGKRSMVTGQPARIALNKGEAVAQAFADVEVRGDAASDVSKALHAAVVDAYHADWPVAQAADRAAMRMPQESAVERLAKVTAPKPPWTDEQMAKEDNYLRNAAGTVILSDEQRALAKELATEVWTDGAKVEPVISAAVKSTTESMGGNMSGWDFRQKTGPSLYRKIQAEAIELANGDPVDETDLRRAAESIKDAVRYTAVMPEEGYWQKGDELRAALESLGAKTIKNPVGIPLEGYRGRNMALTLNGFPFEMQVHTELGVATKDEAHQIYNVSRKLKAELEAKGVDPEDDPAYQKMLHDMQAKWDTMPITTGTPVVRSEGDTKNPAKVLYTTDHTAYYGPTIPNGESALGSPEMVKRERVPSTRYGMHWLPDSPETQIVAPARTLTDEDWNTLPVQHLPLGTVVNANEGTLKKSSIDKVVNGTEPFREGYFVKLLRTDDGKLHVVDGHTRVAMYHALGKEVPVRIMDQATVDDLMSQDIYDIAKANGGITIDLGGDRPVEGYAYAPAKDTERKIHKDKLRAEDIEHYIDDHRALLAKPGNHLGMWEEGDYFYLDVSRVGDASAKTIEEAQKADQLGVFDLKSFDTIDIGKVDDQGRYQALDEATSIHNRHQEQIARDAESRSGSSTLEVPGSGSVTGLTADNKGWGSVAARIPDGTEIKPVYKTGKNGKKQLDVAATWASISDDTLKENWRNAIRSSAPWAQKAGADWYPGVHRLATKLTDKYADTFEKRWGIKLTPDLTAAFFAAYSENNGWDGNLVGVRRLLDGSGSEYRGSLKDFKYDEASDYAGIKAGKYGTRYVMPADTPSKSQLAKYKAGKKIPMFQIPGQGDGWYRLYDFHVNKALRAMQNPRGGIADLRDNAITAPKPADFGANIAGDYSRATADRWVARILLHTDDAEFAESMRGFVKTKNKIPDRIGYKRMSQALMDIAQEPEFKDRGLDAAAVQAIPWVHVVGPLGSIGEIDDLSSYASVKAETLRKAAEFGDVQ